MTTEQPKTLDQQLQQARDVGVRGGEGLRRARAAAAAVKTLVDFTDDVPDHDSKLPDGSTADFVRDGSGHVRIWLGHEFELRLTTFQVIDLQAMLEKLVAP